MIWFAHKKYTPEFYAERMEIIRRNVRISTCLTVAIAVGATAMHVLANMTCIYYL